MSDIAITTSLEITKIYKDVSEDFEIDKTKYGDSMKKRIQKLEHTDDVVVTNVQVFERGGIE